MYNILQLALDFQQSPSKYGDLTDPAKPLPENIDILLEVAAGEVESSAINSDTVIKENISHELLSAAKYFVEHALFIPKGNHYRTLGLEADANQDQIRKHFHLLLKLLYLDREDKSEEWNTTYAMRINHAYSILRDTAKRRSYDHILSKQGVKIVKDDKLYNKDTTVASVPDPSRAALADILNTYQENNRNKPDINKVVQSAANSIPASAPSDVSFIAGNINKANSAANGQSIKANGQNKSAVPVIENKPKVIIRKEPIHRDLTNEELDSFQQLIKTQPTQRTKPFGLSDKNSARYRSITVMLSTALLVVVVIYVIQQITNDTDIQSDVVSELAQVQQSLEVVDDLDSESIPPSTQEVDAVVEPVVPDQSSGDRGQLVESQTVPDVVPPIAAVEQRRRRTIETIPATDIAGPIASERVSDKNTTAKPPATTRETSQKTPAVVSQNKSLVDPVPTSANEKTTKMEMKQDVSQTQLPQVVPSKSRQESVTPVASGRDHVVDFAAETQAPSLSAAPTFDSMVTAQLEKPISNNISDRELSGFIADFVRGYEAGDLALFMNLFAEDAQTPDQNNRQGIRQDYQELFQGTEKRQFIINNLRWVKEDNNRAHGVGGFKVIVQAPGEAALSTFIGEVTFQVQKGPQGILIKRIEHTYGNIGTE